MRKFLLAMFVVVFSVSPLLTLAQTDIPEDSEEQISELTPEEEAEFLPILPEQQAIPNTTTCFDDYEFGSVQTDISPSVLSTVPGVPLTFSGKIKNDNPYPIVDGSVYIKIFKKQKTASNTDLNTKQNGHEIVDQFFAKEKVSIKAKGSEPILFAWQIPRNAPTGDYQAATYFVTAKRFNLSGLSFTDDVTGNKVDFSIKSDVINPPVFFNKNTVTLNQKPHKFAIFPLHFPESENVTAEAELINPSKTGKTIQLTWKLYKWDGLREENKKDEKTETITLKASETKKVSYTVNKDTGSVAYLVAEARDGAMKSILDIRFVREGIEEIRLNFPSITSYPLMQGQENSLFSCVHSTNFPIVKDNTLTLTLKTLSGETIHKYTYQGDISGEMMGVKEAFTPKETVKNFTLTATLKNKGSTIEEVTQTYLCDKLGDNCPKETPTSSSQPSQFLDFGEKDMWLKLVLFLAGAVLLFFIIRRMVMKRSTMSFLLGFLLASSLLFGLGGVERAEGKSVVWSKVINSHLVSNGLVSQYVLPNIGLESSIITVLYNAYATDINGNRIPEGANVPVGSQMKFQFKPYEDTDIFWNGTGYSWDSPYGNWINEAKQSIGCVSSDIIAYSYYSYSPGRVRVSVPVHVSLSVNPNTKSVSSDNLTCGAADNNGDVVCLVTNEGLVSANMTFNRTYFAFYEQALLPEFFSKNENKVLYNYCLRDNAPMMVKRSHKRIEEPLFIIPSVTIPFTFTAVPANNPPTKPTLTGDTSGAPNQLLNFTASNSTDPEGEDIRYGFDFDVDGNGIPNINDVVWMTYVPRNVNPNTPPYVYPSQTKSYNWLDNVTRKVTAIAQDTNVGNYSPWSDPLTVTISVGACGSVAPSATKPSANLCSSGTASVVTGGSGSNWTWMCLGPDNAILTDDDSCSAPFLDLNNCTESYSDTPCDCDTEEKTRIFSRNNPPAGSLSCIAPPSISISCIASEKNACRDFNWREVAP